MIKKTHTIGRHPFFHLMIEKPHRDQNIKSIWLKKNNYYDGIFFAYIVMTYNVLQAIFVAGVS
jgi:hypothetical protein